MDSFDADYAVRCSLADHSAIGEIVPEIPDFDVFEFESGGDAEVPYYLDLEGPFSIRASNTDDWERDPTSSTPHVSG